MSYVIFHVEGGVGKNISSTAVVRAINKQYPEHKIVVVTAYPDIWLCNPRVHKVEQFGHISYFYKNYIEGNDSIILSQDPYRHTDFIYRRKHLSQIWCEMYGIQFDGEKPELYFTNLELDFVANLVQKKSPILMIQAFGGAQGQTSKYSWARDIPPAIAQEVVNRLKGEYRIIQIRREDQIGLDGVESLSLNLRSLILSLFLSDKRLLIDSMMQHAAAALGLSSTVLWIANSPSVFGYNTHQNIIGNFTEGSLKNSIYEPYDIIGDPIQLATPPNDIFNVDMIVSSLTDINKTQ